MYTISFFQKIQKKYLRRFKVKNLLASVVKCNFNFSFSLKFNLLSIQLQTVHLKTLTQHSLWLVNYYCNYCLAQKCWYVVYWVSRSINSICHLSLKLCTLLFYYINIQTTDNQPPLFYLMIRLQSKDLNQSRQGQDPPPETPPPPPPYALTRRHLTHKTIIPHLLHQLTNPYAIKPVPSPQLPIRPVHRTHTGKYW